MIKTMPERNLCLQGNIYSTTRRKPLIKDLTNLVLRFSRSVGTGRRESGNKVAILPSESLSVLDCLTWLREL